FFHNCKLIRRKQCGASTLVRDMNGNEVAGFENFIKRSYINMKNRRRIKWKMVENQVSRFYKRVISNDFHANTGGNFCNFLANAPKPDDSQGFPTKLKTFFIFFLQVVEFRVSFFR